MAETQTGTSCRTELQEILGVQEDLVTKIEMKKDVFIL